jgi:hypothetical protein
MQIVAFNTDIRSDGNGTAAITWIAMEHILKIIDKGVANVTKYPRWSDYYRTEVNKTSLIANESVKNAIVPVNKTSYSAQYGQATTSDHIWVPSYREVGFGTDKETTGVIYSDLFYSNASRKRGHNSGHATAAGNASTWTLRSAHNQTTWIGVGTSGAKEYSIGVATQEAPVIGFCLG